MCVVERGRESEGEREWVMSRLCNRHDTHGSHQWLSGWV